MAMDTTNWMAQKVQERQAKRDWSKLPVQFEQDQVKHLFREFKDYLTARGDIKTRIKASKATTFAELLKAVQ